MLVSLVWFSAPSRGTASLTGALFSQAACENFPIKKWPDGQPLPVRGGVGHGDQAMLEHQFRFFQHNVQRDGNEVGNVKQAV